MYSFYDIILPRLLNKTYSAPPAHVSPVEHGHRKATADGRRMRSYLVLPCLVQRVDCWGQVNPHPLSHPGYQHSPPPRWVRPSHRARIVHHPKRRPCVVMVRLFSLCHRFVVLTVDEAMLTVLQHGSLLGLCSCASY